MTAGAAAASRRVRCGGPPHRHHVGYGCAMERPLTVVVDGDWALSARPVARVGVRHPDEC